MRDAPTAPAETGLETPQRGSRIRRMVRPALAVALLAALALFVDPMAVAARLARLDLPWLIAGVAVIVPSHALLPWRWWFVAQRVQAPLSYQEAIRDHYLASFLNLALPVAAAGPTARAVRHARRLRARGLDHPLRRALRALILERAAGTLVQSAAVAVASVTLLGDFPLIAGSGLAGVGGFGLVALASVAILRRQGAPGRKTLEHAGKALFGGRALLFHTVVSLLVLASLVVGFGCAARATGVPIAADRLVRVAPLIIASMVLPLAVAGWGIREAVSAALFAALGLSAADGVAVSIAFGLLSLVASAPGLALWLPQGARAPSQSWALWPLVLPVYLGACAVGGAIIGSPAVAGAAAGLGIVGWFVRSPQPRRALPANLLTLARIFAIASLPLLWPRLGPVAFSGVLIACFAVDGVDGWLARRLQAATDFGAELDKEGDALLVMMMCLLLEDSGSVGAWILIPGLWRYVYGIWVALTPTHPRAPRSSLGRWIHGALVASLIACFAFPAWAFPAALTGTILVSASFLRSIAYGVRHRPRLGDP